MCCMYEKEVFLRGLRCAKYDAEENGSWLIINRDSFDIHLKGEPVHSTVVLFNIKTFYYFVKVYSRTVERGICEEDSSKFASILDRIFNDTIGCCGIEPKNSEETVPDAVVESTPFFNKRSEKCTLLLKTSPEFELKPHLVTCPECLKCNTHKSEEFENGENLDNVKIEVKEESNQYFSSNDLDSDHNNGNDIDDVPLFNYDLPSDFEIGDKIFDEQIMPEKVPKKRVRKNKPKKVVESENEVKKEFQCTECSKSFDHINSLRSHKRIHAKHPLDRFLKCFSCGEEFVKSIELAKHMRLKHKGVKAIHECSYCSNKFTSLFVLREHLVVHTKEKKHQCMQCGKRFTQSSSLNTHRITVHEGRGKNLMCSLCPTLCQTPSALERHMRVHTLERPFLCNICGDKFSRKEGLKRHNLYRHSNVRAHTCILCTRKFITKASLNRHVKQVHKAKQ